MPADIIIPEDRTWFYARGLENSAEQVEPIELVVQGTIPDYVKGVLYRAGPGTYEIKTKAGDTYEYHHWFDGLSLIHRFEIDQNGRVTYRSRHTAKGIEQGIIDGNWKERGSFGQDPCDTVFQKFFSVFQALSGSKPQEPKADEVNVGVTLTVNSILANATGSTATHRNKNASTLIAKTDANKLQELDPVTLEPLRAFNYKAVDPSLDGPLAPAHSCTDRDTGEFFSFVLSLGQENTYNVFSLKPAADGGQPIFRTLASISDAPPAYLHSFALTKKYVILAVWQCDFSPMKILWDRNMVQAFKTWDTNRPALFYIIDRVGDRGLVAKYTSETFFCFHTVNAYDEGDNIVFDLCGYENNKLITDLYLKNLRSDHPGNLQAGELRRYLLSDVSKQDPKQSQLPTAALITRVTDLTRGFELPTIHPNLYSHPYSYIYGVSISQAHDTKIWDQLIKLDVNAKDPAKSSLVWSQKSCTPSEPIYIPRPGATREDDGVCLSVILDGERNTSFLLVLDATTFKEVGRATLPDGKVVSYGFHGAFVGEKVKSYL